MRKTSEKDEEEIYIKIPFVHTKDLYIQNCDVELRFINFPHIKVLNQKPMNIN